MNAVVKKWGNSAAVQIPAAVLLAARIEIDQSVDVREEDGRIIIEAARARAYEAAHLVAAITAANRHDTIDLGRPVGRELGCALW